MLSVFMWKQKDTAGIRAIELSMVVGQRERDAAEASHASIKAVKF